jgi:hypothetical protein
VSTRTKTAHRQNFMSYVSQLRPSIRGLWLTPPSHIQALSHPCQDRYRTFYCPAALWQMPQGR